MNKICQFDLPCGSYCIVEGAKPDARLKNMTEFRYRSYWNNFDIDIAENDLNEVKNRLGKKMIDDLRFLHAELLNQLGPVNTALTFSQKSPDWYEYYRKRVD